MLLAAVAAGLAAGEPAVPIRWSALGACTPDSAGYPARLQKLLGPAFQVENAVVPGATMLKNVDSSYWARGRLKQTFDFKPDIITIDLGGNDSKAEYWDAHKDEFIGDYQAMVDTLNTIVTKPKVLPCFPNPSLVGPNPNSTGINDLVLRQEIIPDIKQVARTKNLDLVDLSATVEGDVPTGGRATDSAQIGADIIAASIYRAFKEKAVRIACIGNSITDNLHSAGAYPIKFNQLLGRDYLVLNAGQSGSTLMRSGVLPYAGTAWFKEVFRFRPKIITIKLGTNDSQPVNWEAHRDDFIPDLRWLIDTLSTIPTKPRIILCTPLPAWNIQTEPNDVRETIILNEIIPRIRQVAKEKNIEVIDLHTAFMPYESLTTDGIHPNVAGQDTLAHIFYRSFKALREGGLITTSLVLRPARKRWVFRLQNIVNPLSLWGYNAAGRRAK